MAQDKFNWMHEDISYFVSLYHYESEKTINHIRDFIAHCDPDFDGEAMVNDLWKKVKEVIDSDGAPLQRVEMWKDQYLIGAYIERTNEPHTRWKHRVMGKLGDWNGEMLRSYINGEEQFHK